MGDSLFTNDGVKEREIWRSNFLKSLALKLLIEGIDFFETQMKRHSDTALAFYHRHYKILLFIAEIICILMLIKSLKQVFQNYRMPSNSLWMLFVGTFLSYLRKLVIFYWFSCILNYRGSLMILNLPALRN